MLSAYSFIKHAMASFYNEKYKIIHVICVNANAVAKQLH